MRSCDPAAIGRAVRAALPVLRMSQVHLQNLIIAGDELHVIDRQLISVPGKKPNSDLPEAPIS